MFYSRRPPSLNAPCPFSTCSKFCEIITNRSAPNANQWSFIFHKNLVCHFSGLLSNFPTPGPLSFQLKIYIYQYTFENSPLRKLFVDRTVRIFLIWKELGDELPEFLKHESLEGEFAINFVSKLVGYLDIPLVIRHEEESLTEEPKYMNYSVGDKNGKDRPTFQGFTPT